MPVISGRSDKTPSPSVSVISMIIELPAEYGIMQAKLAINPIKSILIAFLSSVFPPFELITLEVIDLAIEYKYPLLFPQA